MITDSSVNGGSTAVLGNASNGHLNGLGYVAGTTSNITFNGGQLSAPTSQLQTNITAANSTNFYSVLSNSNVAWTSQKGTFTATADSTGLSVFNLSYATTLAIFALGKFDFILNGATTVIINAWLKNINIFANFLGGSTQWIAGNVI